MLYRFYFQVLSDVLLSGAMSELTLVFQHAIIPLVSRADILATRMAPYDIEFLYCFIKLLTRLDLMSPHAHQHVNNIKNSWMKVLTKFMHNRRIRYARPTIDIPHTSTSTPSPSSAGSRQGNVNRGDAQSTVTTVVFKL